MVHAVQVALAQYFLEVAVEIWHPTLAAMGHELAFEGACCAEASFPCEHACEFGLVVARCVVVKLLTVLGARHAILESLHQQFAQSLLVGYRPGHRGLAQNVPANRIGLFLLALQFEFASLLLPILQGRLCRFRLHRLSLRQPQQSEQGVTGVRFDQVQVADRACQRHVQRVDEKLIHLQRLVFLVACPSVFKVVDSEVFGHDALDDIGELLSVVGDEAVQHDVVVLQPLRFVDREQQRGGESLSGFSLVLVAHHQYREAGGLAHGFVELA